MPVRHRGSTPSTPALEFLAPQDFAPARCRRTSSASVHYLDLVAMVRRVCLRAAGACLVRARVSRALRLLERHCARARGCCRSEVSLELETGQRPVTLQQRALGRDVRA